MITKIHQLMTYIIISYQIVLILLFTTLLNDKNVYVVFYIRNIYMITLLVYYSNYIISK